MLVGQVLFPPELFGGVSTLHSGEASTTTSDRRVHTRQTIRSRADLDLDSTNGGVVLDLSEGGLALRSDAKLIRDNVLPMRFELPTLHQRIEARGRVIWRNESKKVAGIKFDELPDDALQKIREWISTQQCANRKTQGNSAQDRRNPEPISVPDPAEPQQAASAASNWFAPHANPGSTDPQLSKTAVPRPLAGAIGMTKDIGDHERAVQHGAEVSTVPSRKQRNRRLHPRQIVNALASYVDLGPDNGGMVVNVSEGGLALTALAKLVEGQLLQLRFQLPELQDWIEATGRITWLSESKKEAGVKFEQLSADARTRIRSWLSTQRGNEARREAPAPELDWLAALRSPAQPSASPLPAPLPAREKREATLERPRQDEGSQTSELSWNRLAAIGAVVAVLSFGTGILIDRHFSQRSAGTAEGKVADVVQQGQDINGQPSGLASEKGSSPGTQTPNQADMASVAGSLEKSGSASTSNSQPQDSEGGAEKETNPAPRERQDGHGAPEQQRPLDYEGTHKVPADKPSITEANKSTPATLPPMTLARPTAPTESTTPAHEAVSPQISDTTPVSGTALSSEAVPVVNPNQPKNLPRPTDATPNAASASSSVTITMPPFPSIRVPPQLKADLSRPGTELQMAQLVSRVEVVYPSEAIRQRIEGTVKLYAIIGRDGAVSVAATGPPLLREAATSAVRQWRYKPTVLGGQAIEAEEDIVVVFRLSAPASASK
jgi:protein TonB